MSNNGGVYTWSKTAASNAGADNTVNWAEGQAPSSINDSARSLMASAAKWRDDISGAILTTGTSAAYIIASNQIFDTLADFHGQMIAFTPHVTNAAGPVTVTVDGFANLPLRTSPGKELLAGTLIQGTPYTALYNNVDGSLYLEGFFGIPTTYNVPLAAGMPFFGTTAPNSSFAFPFGQAISRTTYATLFALLGTTYGVGDGSTTFNIPDLRGRVPAGVDNMGGSAAGRISVAGGNFDGTVLGGTGGAQNHTLTTPEIPIHNHTLTDPGHIHLENLIGVGGGSAYYAPSSASSVVVTSGVYTNSATTGITIAAAGGGNPHTVLSPTIVCNYIMRII